MTELKNAVTSAVVAGVLKAIKNPDTSAAMRDRPAITDAVLDQVVPIVVNATNAEPWYQSKVTIGAVLTLVTAGYALGLDFADGTPPDVNSFSAQMGTIAGALVVLWGRWLPGKPLGS